MKEGGRKVREKGVEVERDKERERGGGGRKKKRRRAVGGKRSTKENARANNERFRIAFSSRGGHQGPLFSVSTCRAYRLRHRAIGKGRAEASRELPAGDVLSSISTEREERESSKKKKKEGGRERNIDTRWMLRQESRFYSCTRSSRSSKKPTFFAAEDSFLTLPAKGT